MLSLSRVALLTASICCATFSTAQAVEVSSRLLRVSGTAVPETPQPPGSVIDLDAAGALIRGVVNLDWVPLDGAPGGPWTCTLEFLSSGGAVHFPAPMRNRQYPVLDPGRRLYGVRDPDPACPLPLPWFPWQPIHDGQLFSGWTMQITRMASQSDFSGELSLHVGSCDSGACDQAEQLALAFDSLPADPPPCAGDVLLLDTDGDGEADARDLRSGFTDASAGPGVDENGVTIADFCWGEAQRDASICRTLDFRNDETGRRKPRDCRMIRPRSGSRYCGAGEFFGSSSPVAPPRTCLGHALLEDADADGEPDTTDRCPGTPAGSAIDGSGCSTEQFCSLQSVQLCQRADFANDEPLAKRPGDCARTRSEPHTCTAAAPR